MFGPKFNHRPAHERKPTTKCPASEKDTRVWNTMWTPGIDPDFDGMGMWTAQSFHVAPGLDAIFGENFAAPSLHRADSSEA